MRRLSIMMIAVMEVMGMASAARAADDAAGAAGAAGGPVEPDASRTMIIVELSDKYPGSRSGVGNPLERLAAISPREAKITAGLALKEPRNRGAMIDGFSAIVEYEKPARDALAEAESQGIGTVVLVTLVQRSIGDIGSSEHRLYADVTLSQHAKAKAPWRRLASRRLVTTTDKQRDADDRIVTDCDNMARQVFAMLRQTMTTQVVPVRYKGVRKTPEGMILQLGIVNNAGRKITNLSILVPTRGSGEPLNLKLDTAIEPGQPDTLAFAPVKHEEAAGAQWTNLQVLGVGFEGVNPDDQAPGFFENLRERLRLLQ